jgi:hypothetical protein
MTSLSCAACAVLAAVTIFSSSSFIRSSARAAAGGAEQTGPVIREERSVMVGGVRERWRLAWTSPPKPACAPDADMQLEWFTCPCTGFAFGEQGDLELIRVTSDGSEDRLALTPFFDDDFNPAGGAAVLPRRPVRDGDRQAIESEGAARFASELRRRADVELMNVRDFDHDGRASEFFVQISSAPCGKRMGIVVGVSRQRPGLHAFGSASNPSKPLILRVDHWQALAGSAGPTTRVDWRCGDHGGDTQEELALRADRDGIHVTRRVYGCNADGSRGALMRSEEE